MIGDGPAIGANGAANVNAERLGTTRAPRGFADKTLKV
jgi:hypothetical protein